MVLSFMVMSVMLSKDPVKPSPRRYPTVNSRRELGLMEKLLEILLFIVISISSSFTIVSTTWDGFPSNLIALTCLNISNIIKCPYKSMIILFVIMDVLQNKKNNYSIFAN